MLKRKATKVFFVLFCLITLVMPHISTVLAEVTKMSSPANLYVILPHEGGEVSGEIGEGEAESYRNYYDTKQYVYRVGGNTDYPDGITVFKIVSDDSSGINYQNELYCLNATNQFPGEASLGTRDVEYTEVANFANATDLNVRSLNMGTSYSGDTSGWTSNYNAVIWLVNNIYLKHQAPEQRNEFIDRAFAGWDEDILARDEIKYVLTDDDIDVVQQRAIWYFTNADDPTYHTEELPAVRIAEISDNLNFESYRDKFGTTIRLDLMKYLYSYLINSAKTGTVAPSVTFPELDSSSATISSTDPEYHIVGPFKVTAGTADPSQYILELLDQNGNAINRNDYKIKIEGQDDFTNLNLNQIFNVNYYIYLPKTNRSITKVQLHYKYTSYETESSLWQSTREVNQGEKPYQPVVLITRGDTPHEVLLPYEIAPEADLALRKYIVKVNDNTITNRKPNISLDGLKNGEMTAEYKHKKEAVKVGVGDKVVYEIRVYNEGSVNASGAVIVDALPKGLKLAENSTVNQTYGWTKVSEGNNLVVYKTTKLEATQIPAFDPDTDTELPSAYVQIECEIENDSTGTLTNVAEILSERFTNTSVIDRDSSGDNNTAIKTDSKTDDYKGNSENKNDLTDSNYFYKGLEDDDDFEKVVVARKFDLSLIKFITKTEYKRSDTDTQTTTYTDRGQYQITKTGNGTVRIDKTTKPAVKVKDTSLITYTIRVFNEGQVAGYAAKVKDNIPTGLVFVPDNATNTTYGWKMYDAQGNETTDVSQAVYIETDYLNKENSDARGERALQPVSGETTVDYRDLQVVFKVNISSTNGNTIRNIAEISDDTDEDGNPVIDDDSTPDNDDPEEDDLDEEEVYVEGFDLNLKKFVSKLNKNALTVNRAPEVNVTPLKQGKTDAEYTFRTNKTPVKVKVGDIVEYTIRVYNEGEVNGYAEEVSDYIPEGLGFLPQYKTNVDNYWSLTNNTYELRELKLSDIENGTKNLSADDFSGIRTLDDVTVCAGKLKITSSKLDSRHEDKLLHAFDPTKTTLDSQDITVVCIVLADVDQNNNLRNIAEVTENKDENKNPTTDIDSTPDTVNPDNYPDGEKRPDGTPQDDNDYEKLVPAENPNVFDLSLKKFITKLNNTEIKGREPSFVVNTKDNTLSVQSAKVDPLQVEYGDKVTYTIRVYNEGEINGYAAEVKDNIPNGLTFEKDDSTNQKYGWKMYDKDGKETTDTSKAVTIRTNYLNKANSTARGEGPLKAYTQGTSKFDYRDLQVVFTVNKNALKTNTSMKNDTIKNIAEISEDTDENGNPIDDIDSTPNNDKSGEDDIDNEEIFVKYFDLALRKDLIKIEITEDGTRREVLVNSTDGLQKVEIHRKKIDKTIVKFVYRITITNEGQIPGYATEIKDYIPEGLEFISEENKQWTKISDRLISTNALSTTKLEPGKSASVDVVLKWINGDKNMGLKTNAAEISKDKNDSGTPDIDSTPDNKVVKEDDYDTADVFLAISTGTNQTYLMLVFVVLTILTTGLIVIKKYVL